MWAYRWIPESLVSYFCDNSFAEDAVDSVDVDVEDVKMTRSKDHHHLHLPENWYYL
jgi:hypothetical protein